MILLIEKIGAGYQTLLDWGDPRVAHLPSMNSPLLIFTLSILYLLFVLKIGPSFMKNREPYNLDRTIITYNIIQIILNFSGIVWSCVYIFDVDFSCTPVDKPDMAAMHYGYFVLKCIDLLETIFFVLRKKFSQITFLHLYHHVWMFLGTWATCKYFPGGQLFFLGIANTTVHVVMYCYYLLTAWDSHYKKSVWWKKYITQLQICQHCFIWMSFAVPLLINPTCSYSKGLMILGLFQTTFILYLFVDFYVKVYIRKSKKEV